MVIFNAAQNDKISSSTDHLITQKSQIVDDSGSKWWPVLTLGNGLISDD